MVDSIRASEKGLRIVDQARRKKRWNKTAEAWCMQGFTSRATLSRFWAGQPIRKEIFIAICEAVGANWQEVADGDTSSMAEVKSRVKRMDALTPGLGAKESQNTNGVTHPTDRQDWGDAPTVNYFYGRTDELTTLNQWIGQEQCHLVALLGLGGMGKTALAAKFAQSHQQEFECMIWRSLRNAPSLDALLIDLLQFLFPSQVREIQANLDSQILQLLKGLRTHRCLLVLDGVDSILQDGYYRAGYEEYRQLFTCISETQHQSCLLLTAREMPKELSTLEGETLPVRYLSLKGVTWTEGQQIVQSKGTLTGSTADWMAFVECYAGNPLALKMVASTIRSMFGGSLVYFLAFVQKNPFLVNEVGQLIAEHVDRLNSLEQDLLYWLAIHHKPMTIEEVQEGIAYPLSISELMQMFATLQRRCLIEITIEQTAHNPQSTTILKYTTNALIKQMNWGMAQPYQIHHPSLQHYEYADTSRKNNKMRPASVTSSPSRLLMVNERKLALAKA